MKNGFGVKDEAGIPPLETPPLAASFAAFLAALVAALFSMGPFIKPLAHRSLVASASLRLFCNFFLASS